MAGINRYQQVRLQYGNLHEVFGKLASVKVSMASMKPRDPCIFLSHRSTDKAAVKRIGEYIMDKGVDVYIDIDDTNLQNAVASNDHKAITAAIELGISHSTDLLAYITSSTLSTTSSSVWVPFEIGFAKRNNNYLAALKSKDVPTLPSYLEIVRRINGIADLNAYLQEVISRKEIDLTRLDISRASFLANLKLATAGSELSSYLSS